MDMIALAEDKTYTVKVVVRRALDVTSFHLYLTPVHGFGPAGKKSLCAFASFRVNKHKFFVV